MHLPQVSVKGDPSTLMASFSIDLFYFYAFVVVAKVGDSFLLRFNAVSVVNVVDDSIIFSLPNWFKQKEQKNNSI